MSYAGDITVRDAWDRLTGDPRTVLVDCRTQAEWNFVGVPDISSLGKRALFIEWVDFPNGALNQRFVDDLLAAGVEGDAEVLFLCRSGARSIGAAEAATAAGFTKAYNILDGFEGATDAEGHRGAAGWRAESLPWRQS
ncbi:rhodanese-like domain-containing protein [Gordonia zhaorongruii]|uniref:rhodanese-like domain-containing protein n=1 Tax=Gordonia zhaorongruii TaxID=2597659 RepID=UPI0010528D77|nr:rhodanese-like domain-containing protein [Gordonia zhaorongruii]